MVGHLDILETIGMMVDHFQMIGVGEFLQMQLQVLVVVHLLDHSSHQKHQILIKNYGSIMRVELQWHCMRE